jgi:MFS family permease
LLAGWLLSNMEKPRVFACLYFAGGFMASVSIIAFWLVDDPAERAETDARRPSFGEMLARFRQSLADTNFRNFLVARIFSSAGFCILPLIAYHFSTIEGGALDPGHIVCYGAAMTAGSAISNLLLGRLGDHHGHRIGLVVGAVAQMSALTMLLSAQGPVACVTAYFLAGIVVGSSLVSHQNMMFETCPHDQRIAHLTVGALVLGTFTSLLPLIAGLAAQAWDLHSVFAGALALSAIAFLWLLLRVKEPRVLLVNEEA